MGRLKIYYLDRGTGGLVNREDDDEESDDTPAM